MDTKQITLELAFSASDPRQIAAAYFRFATSTITRTVEVVENTLFADFDQNGNVVGIELLGPVSGDQLHSKSLSLGEDRARSVEETLNLRAREFLVPKAA